MCSEARASARALVEFAGAFTGPCVRLRRRLAQQFGAAVEGDLVFPRRVGQLLRRPAENLERTLRGVTGDVGLLVKPGGDRPHPLVAPGIRGGEGVEPRLQHPGVGFEGLAPLQVEQDQPEQDRRRHGPADRRRQLLRGEAANLRQPTRIERIGEDEGEPGDGRAHGDHRSATARRGPGRGRLPGGGRRGKRQV